MIPFCELCIEKRNHLKIDSKSRDNVYINMPSIEEQKEAYIRQLNPQEKIAYEIAKTKLESSFDLEKSIGFLAYMKKQHPSKV
tara:strand:+ start:806 stop:1054 length:249 start_codon:yes stop_codon:yes gene_type:complete